MSWDGRQLAVLSLGVLAAFAVLASTAMLVADAAVARRQAPLDAQLIEALAERVRTDAEAAAELGVERQRQTETSLRREVGNRRLGWALLLAGAVFLSAAKWLLRQRRQTSYPPALSGAAAHSHGFQPVEPQSFPLAPSGAAAYSHGSQPVDPPVDLAFVDALVAQHSRSREATIPMLQAIQSHYGYLPDAALRRLCQLTEITPAAVAGTSTFYARFRHSPAGEHLVRLCHGTACHVAGARWVDEELRRQLEIPAGADTDPRRRFTLEPVACVGCCSLAPVMMLGEETAGHLTPATAGPRLAVLAEKA